MTIDELTSTEFASDDERHAAVLAFGKAYFEMDTGIISRIETDYEIVALDAPREFDVLSVGMEFPITDTYCAKICDTSDVVTYTHVGVDPEMNLHPVYQAFQLESYIGAPIITDGKVTGTLNFSSPRILHAPFSEEQIEVIRRMAALL